MTSNAQTNELAARVERIRTRRLFATPKRVQLETPPVGTVERRVGDTLYIWLYATTRKNKPGRGKRGRRGGEIDRNLPRVLCAVKFARFHSERAYYNYILRRCGLTPYEGMSIGGKNIIIPQGADFKDGLPSTIHSYQQRANTHAGRGGVKKRGRACGPDSFDQLEDGADFMQSGIISTAIERAEESRLLSPDFGKFMESAALELAAEGSDGVDQAAALTKELLKPVRVRKARAAAPPKAKKRREWRRRNYRLRTRNRYNIEGHRLLDVEERIAKMAAKAVREHKMPTPEEFLDAALASTPGATVNETIAAFENLRVASEESAAI